MPVTDIKANLSEYLFDIPITQHGSIVTTSFQDKLETARSLFGILPQVTTFEEAKNERYESFT